MCNGVTVDSTRIHDLYPTYVLKRVDLPEVWLLERCWVSKRASRASLATLIVGLVIRTRELSDGQLSQNCWWNASDRVLLLILARDVQKKIPIERSTTKHEQQRTELELALDTEMPREERISAAV